MRCIVNVSLRTSSVVLIVQLSTTVSKLVLVAILLVNNPCVLLNRATPAPRLLCHSVASLVVAFLPGSLLDPAPLTVLLALDTRVNFSVVLLVVNRSLLLALAALVVGPSSTPMVGSAP